MAAPWFILGHFTFLSFRQFRFLHCFPFLELPLAFLGFVVGDNVGKYAPGDWFNDVLRNTWIVYGFTFAAHKFWFLRVILNFQGTTVDVRMGCWSMADLLFKFWLSKSPGVNVRSIRHQIYKQNADTRQERLHRSYFVAQLLYHWSEMLSRQLGA